MQDATDNKRVENARLRSDLLGQKDLNRDCTDKKRALIDDNQGLRDRNGKDYAEIDQLQAVNESRARESAELQQKIKILDYDLQKAIQRSEECSKLLEQRTQELKAKELQLLDLENEVTRMRA